MSTTMSREAMQTISARLPKEDMELFHLICEEYRITTSEAIRYLIQNSIQETFYADEGVKKGFPNEIEFKQIKKQKEQDRFYENFKQLNRQNKRPHLRINSL